MKILNRLTILLMLVLTLAAGCVSIPTTSTLTIATATTGGVWYPLGSALAGLVTRHVPGVTATALVTGGAIENLKLLTAGRVDVALAYDYHVARLNQGALPAVAEGSQPVRIVLGLYEHPLHIITRGDSGISRVTDLKGKRVSTGATDSRAEEQAGYVFKALGIDWDRDFTRSKLGVTESAAALKAGQIDAFIWSGAVPSTAAPTAALADLAADPAVKMTIVPINGNSADAIQKANPGVFHRAYIKKGEYAGLNADVETLAVTAVLATMDSYPSGRLAAILDAIFEDKAELAEVWRGVASLSPERSLAVLAPEARQYLHPATEAVVKARETVYQVATYSALAAGLYGGVGTVGELRAHGDLGIGTFDGLDGELIMLDGAVYQARADGVVVLAADDATVPFGDTTIFDQEVNQDLGEVASVAALQAALDKLMVRKDAFYAIRIDAEFAQVKVRCPPKQQIPYPTLAEALKNQVFFEYSNVRGTVVGFWTPEYASGVNVAGYNLHFISADRTKGGHLVEGHLSGAKVSLDETRNLAMVLRPAGE